ncbi:MAG: CHAT domain-containing protein [Proteobacteria bacterium]|nr:CHAT domain-containing protein [Pseudomonadota bacterium]MBI3497121.1 CHAT domain-containing protein [Pseudomonadota bacterium]
MLKQPDDRAEFGRRLRCPLSRLPALSLAIALTSITVALLPLREADAQSGTAAPLQRQETEASPDQLLDEAFTANPERLAQAKAKAAEPPPQTNDAERLAQFYRNRGVAAQIASLPQQAIEDFRRAAELARQAPSVDRGEILWHLATVLGGIQRTLPAINFLREAIEATPQNRRGRVIGWYSQLAGFQGSIGNLPAAERSVAQCQEQYQQLINSPRRNFSEQLRLTWHVQVLRAEAALWQARGRQVKAEPLLREALEEAQKLPNGGGVMQALHATLSRNLMVRGRLGEAENEARLALAQAQRAGGAGGMQASHALLGLAVVLMEEGRVVESETLIRKSIEIFKSVGLQANGGVRFPLAHALAAQGRWREAYDEFEVARKSFAQIPQQFELKVRQDVTYPLVLLKSGHGPEAVERLAAMADTATKRFGERHYAVAALPSGLYAVALAETGSTDRALAEFQSSVPFLLQRSREANDEEDSAAGREQRVRLVLESYISLLADLAASGKSLPNLDPAAEAFRLAEAARGQSVVRALAASSARAAAATPELAEIARREQDAQLQLSALNGLLANAISARAEDQDENAIKTLRVEIDQLRDERAKIAGEIERRFPDYANLINPKPASLADARSKLQPGEALLAFYVGERRTYVWAVSPSGAHFNAAQITRDDLTRQVAALRQALDPNAQSLDDVPAFDVAAAQRLYATLIQPTEPAWGEAKSLLMVPHGPLGQLPLGLLPTTPASLEKTGLAFAGYAKVPWLLRRVAVSQLPSVASFLTLRALPAGRGDRRPFVGFGDPWFSLAQAEEAKAAMKTEAAPLTTRGVRLKLRSAPRGADIAAEMAQLPRLPDTAEEVQGVAQALKADAAHEVFLGAAASRQTVTGLKLASWRIVMFATHGLVPGDLTGLTQPALALSAPEVTGDAGTGLLTTEDILALKLDADWVILSACNTAAGQGAGAEAISGLGRAFFYAGARALLVSNWPVETTSARTITTDLFQRQAENPGLSRAEALRQAILALIDSPGYLDPGSGKPLFSYAHPIFWAAFSLVGDGGGTWR